MGWNDFFNRVRGDDGTRPRIAQYLPIDTEQGQVQQPSEFRPSESIGSWEDYFNSLPHSGQGEAMGSGMDRPRVVANQPMMQTQDADPLLIDRQRIQEIQNRPTTNKDSGWKGWLKEFAQNVGGNFNEARKNNPNGSFLSNLGEGLGGGLTGGTIDRSQNERRTQQDDLAKAYQTYGINKGMADDKIAQEYKQSQVDYNKQKPVTDIYNAETKRLKTESDAEYRDNQMALGTKKADELKVYRDAIVDLKLKGIDQNDSRIKLLQDTFEERKRSNQEGEKDKDLDREARITVSKIMANASMTNTNTRESGLNSRQQIANQMQEKMSWLKTQQDLIKTQVDVEKKHALELQIEQGRKDLLALRQQYDQP